MRTFLDFEKPIAELESKIDELRHISSSSELNIAEEVTRLQDKLNSMLRQTYNKLTPGRKRRSHDTPNVRIPWIILGG